MVWYGKVVNDLAGLCQEHGSFPGSQQGARVHNEALASHTVTPLRNLQFLCSRTLRNNRLRLGILNIGGCLVAS